MAWMWAASARAKDSVGLFLTEFKDIRGKKGRNLPRPGATPRGHHK